jgi:hypothetical protein
MCGAIFESTCTNAKHCETCRDTRKKELSRQYQAAHREQRRLAAKERYAAIKQKKKNRRTCYESLIETNRKARELGLSYGQYVAMQRR